MISLKGRMGVARALCLFNSFLGLACAFAEFVGTRVCSCAAGVAQLNPLGPNCLFRLLSNFPFRGRHPKWLNSLS